MNIGENPRAIAYEIFEGKVRKNIPLWRGNELANNFLRVCRSKFDALDSHRLHPFLPR